MSRSLAYKFGLVKCQKNEAEVKRVEYRRPVFEVRNISNCSRIRCSNEKPFSILSEILSAYNNI